MEKVQTILSQQIPKHGKIGQQIKCSEFLMPGANLLRTFGPHEQIALLTPLEFYVDSG